MNSLEVTSVLKDSQHNFFLRIISMVLVFRVVEGLKIFPLVFSLTQGGPGNSTEELTYFAYSEGFVKFKTGYASASSMLMFAVLLVLIVFFYGKKSKAK